MAQFLRGKQAGIQSDLSAGLEPDLFALDDIARYGINSQISTLAYDPIQSLLAVGTNESQYGTGQIYIFGQKRVEVKLDLPRKASVKILQFCADKLVCVDSKNELLIYSLESEKLMSKHVPPGYITALTTDPSLDWAFLGLQNGDVVVYDLDRAAVAPLKIPSFWKHMFPKSPMLPVVSLALHPRDIGSLLIGCTEGAVVYSFKQNTVVKDFQIGGPHGPKLTHALWHPTGTFILIVSDDSTLSFWDPKDGRMVMARTIQEPRVNPSRLVKSAFGGEGPAESPNQRIFKASWCSKENPDDTGLLIAGGLPIGQPMKGLTFFDLGPTPVYATSSWQIFSQHFENPKLQRMLPTPPQPDVVDYVLIPRFSPHYAGGHDPIAVIALLSSGELVTMSFPSGHPISPTNQLHLSLSFVHPFVGAIGCSSVERAQWLSMQEDRALGPPILKGGVEARNPIKRYMERNIMVTAHADGTVRLWDAGHGAEAIEQEDVLQVDVARALGRLEDVEVTNISLSRVTGELAIGLRTGEIAVFKKGRNHQFGRSDAPPVPPPSHTPTLVDIQGRGDPGLKEGLMPFTLLNQQASAVTALKMSDVGFVAAGFESGDIMVIDLRGPAIIYHSNTQDLAKQVKRSSMGTIRKRSNSHTNTSKRERPSFIEFGVMSLEGDDYSSILVFIGTIAGRVLTLKILPEAGGRFGASFAGAASLEDKIIGIAPINAENGKPATATQPAVAGLRTGLKVNGVLLVTTQTGARIFRPVAAKGVHKTWDGVLAYSSAVCAFEGRRALVAIFGDNCARAYSIPALKEIGVASLSRVLDPRKLSETVILPSGAIFGWTGPSEIAQVNCWGVGRDFTKPQNKLFNVDAVIPPRPTISNMQWIAGTQYVSPTDLDVLIGGPDRQPSARQIAAAREQQTRPGPSTGSSRVPSGGPSSGKEPEGWGEYMQRQINERTEKLNIMGDSMESVQQQSEGWATDVNKFISRQKRNVIVGGLTGKFF